jgi:glycosyltransferase involved in cell wall biosynthesis
MRIIHVNGELGFSGGEVQTMLLLRGLRDHGHQNLVCAAADSALATQATQEGFEVAPVTLHNDGDIRAIFSLTNAFKRNAADLVHLHTGRAIWLGGLAAKRAGLPVVAIWHHLVDAAAGISATVMEQMRDGGVSAARRHLIYSSVDPSSVSTNTPRTELRTAHGLTENDTMLLALGSLNRRKGFDVLIESLATLAQRDQHPQLWIGGDGPEKNALLMLTQERGLENHVRFLGQSDQVAALLQVADVVVMPSRAEGLGIAALEAMAAGRPLIASRVGGLAESIIHEQSGLLVPPEDPDSLADAIERLLKDSDLRTHLNEGGPRRIQEQFLPETMVTRYLALYDALMSNESR